MRDEREWEREVVRRGRRRRRRRRRGEVEMRGERER